MYGRLGRYGYVRHVHVLYVMYVIIAMCVVERYARRRGVHEQACMSLANQMIENMEESNFDTEKFAKMNDLLFSRMTNEQCTDTEGWKKIVSYSPEG